MAALDRSGFEKRLHFCDRLDDDADILVFLGEAMDASGRGRVDPRAEKMDVLIGGAGGSEIAPDRDGFALNLEPRLLAGLPNGDRERALVGVDKPRHRFDLPRRGSGEESRQAELLDENDAVQRGVVKDNGDGLAAPHHVVSANAAPFPGKEAMAEAEKVEPQKAFEGDPLLEKFEVGMMRRRGDGRLSHHVFAAAGRRIITESPPFGRFPATIVPPIAATLRRAMARPMPK